MKLGTQVRLRQPFEIINYNPRSYLPQLLKKDEQTSREIVRKMVVSRM